jgi:hypothetical protein
LLSSDCRRIRRGVLVRIEHAAPGRQYGCNSRDDRPIECRDASGSSIQLNRTQPVAIGFVTDSIGQGHAGVAALGILLVDADQLLRIGKWERTEQQRVDYAEYGNVGADVEGKCQDGYEGETTIAAEGAEGVAEILKKNVETHKFSRLAPFVFCQVDAAEANECLEAVMNFISVE